MKNFCRSLDEREEGEEEDSPVNDPAQPVVHSVSQHFSSNVCLLSFLQKSGDVQLVKNYPDKIAQLRLKLDRRRRAMRFKTMQSISLLPRKFG